MSILVTGASGFVGAHVVDVLLATGHQKVVAADIATTSVSRDDRRVTTVNLDITDTAATRAIIDHWRPEAIIHAAAITPGVDDEMRDATQIMAVNIGGTANIVSSAMTAGGVRRIVLFSSSGVYNGISAYPDRLTESAQLPQTPSSLYAVTKLACEGLAHRVAATGLISICAIRVASVYGEHERATQSRSAARTSQIHKLAMATAAGDVPVRIGGPNIGRDWVHGADVGHAVSKLLAASRLNHVVYNVGSGETTRFHDLVGLFRSEGLAEKGGPEAAEIVVRAEDDRPPLDIERLFADTGFRPMVALEDGVRALVSFHRGRWTA
jgi:nucleoside-diphosphate-sugar epimerase